MMKFCYNAHTRQFAIKFDHHASSLDAGTFVENVFKANIEDCNITRVGSTFVAYFRCTEVMTIGLAATLWNALREQLSLDKSRDLSEFTAIPYKVNDCYSSVLKHIVHGMMNADDMENALRIEIKHKYATYSASNVPSSPGLYALHCLTSL